MANLSSMDKLAMYIGGALIVLAIPVMGTIVMLAGSMSPLYTYSTGDGTGTTLAPSMAPEGAEIVASPVIDPILRGYLILAGFALLMLAGIAKLFTSGPEA